MPFISLSHIHVSNISILTSYDRRDAQYETDAVLEHYFNHDNTAPFLATRIIQRFGISNASPRYVKTAATAFTTGSYVSQGISFGSGKYGDLGAMLAAIVLDREFQLPILDAGRHNKLRYYIPNDSSMYILK